MSTLDYLIGSFDSDIITMDYRVRGFTRDVNGKKLFMDHRITSIQDYIDPEILRRYDAVDINVYAANLFHTRMMIKDIDLQNYLFKTDVYELPPQTRLEIMNNLRREMIEIFSGRNILLNGGHDRVTRDWIYRKERPSMRRWNDLERCGWFPLTCPAIREDGEIRS